MKKSGDADVPRGTRRRAWRRWLVRGALLLATLGWSAPAIATDKPEHRLILADEIRIVTGDFVASNSFRFAYRYDPAKLELGVSTLIAPMMGRVRGYMAFKPFGLLHLYVASGFVGYPGWLGHVQSWPDAASDFGPDARDAREDDASGVIGVVTDLGGQTRFGVKGVKLRYRWRFSNYQVDLPQGQTTFYEVLDDVLVEDGGWLFAHLLDIDVGILTIRGKRLVSLGARWKMSLPFHGADASDDAKQATHAVGPIITLGPIPTPYTTVDNLALEIGVLWWASHPYRTGRDTAAGTPTFFIAFRFDGYAARW